MERKSSNLVNLVQWCISNQALLAGKVLHAQIFRLSLFSDTFLSNNLIELYSKCDYIAHAYHVFDKIPQKNIFSWNAILAAYCKASNLRNACRLFLQMPERNTVSLNTIISTMVRCGYERQALDTYDSMLLEGVKPSHITFATVFSACGALMDADCGRRNHGLVVKAGFESNIYVVNTLLCMYAKCGLNGDAIRVFRDIPEPNEVTFTTMMSGLAQTNQVKEASELFRLMLRKGVHVDSVSLSSILGVCAKGGFGERDIGSCDHCHGFSMNAQGKQVHTLSIKLGFERDLHLSNSLLDMYAKVGDMDSAEKFFVNLNQRSVVSWNIMIAGYGNRCNSEKAAEYLQRMQCCGYEPDDITYVNMLAACVKSGDVKTGRQIFDCMPCPSLTSWNAILSGYNQNADHKEAVKLFRKMQFQCQHADRTTLAVILSSCAELGLVEAGKQVHAVSQKFGFYDDVYVASSLINVYSKCGKMELSKHVFSKLPELDVVCWNSMLAGFSINSLEQDALSFFKQMRQLGFFPSEFSFATITSSCAKLSSLFQGQQIHAQIIKDGFVDDIFVGSSITEMYCKCGDVVGARCFFDRMPGKNTVTWNEMIHGYAQNGYGHEALCLYNDMISSGEKPDDITFVAVLTACSHSALVDEGLEIFNAMPQNFGVMPKLDHYTCIIDCLSRAGRFHEVEVILNTIPCKDDAVVWEVVLSSCRVHANLSLAKRAAEELHRLDPQNPASYVLLANMYSSLGRWDDAHVVRELMSNNQVRKEPGYSQSECKNDMQIILQNNQ
ncbi:pentatricopeptide repeat-containing protein At4g20770-like [Abrus precatorius]|uniref:Pentatricopeptide repeat-containing protein At4g20770-like n=1 Tax=Abrus precatorius TaxID=3816 RepID=A0A8B8M4B4_ABRPR|nr:pentatricopeptide repeat-containing protein At4g20770-like [Abrus precatorius]